MEVLRTWIVRVLQKSTETRMKYKKRWGYMLAQTRYPALYRNQKGGFVVRSRIKDPAGKAHEIMKSQPWETELEALQWLEAEKVRIKSGSPRQQSKLFSEYVADLIDRKLARREIKSRAGESKWRVSLTHFIGGTHKDRFPPVQGLGDYPVTEIRPVHIEQWKDQIAPLITGGAYSPVTINGWLTVLRTVSKTIAREYEVRDFMLGVEDFDTSEHHTYTEEEPNALKPDDVPRFLSLMRERWPQHYAMVLLGFVTGLRPSTLRPLRRRGSEADVLWDEGRLLVRRSEVNGTVLNTTKTGIRYSIPLPEEVMSVLKWHVETQLTECQEHSDLLFPPDIGGFRSGSCLKKPFADVTACMELSYRLTPRGMRRTFQDLTRRAQVSDLVTRSISGHATEQMHHHYSTVSADEQRESLSRVFEVINGGASHLENQSGGKTGGSGSGTGGKIEKAS